MCKVIQKDLQQRYTKIYPDMEVPHILHRHDIVATRRRSSQQSGLYSPVKQHGIDLKI